MAITSPKDIPGLVVWWSAEAQSSRFADGQAITDRIWDSSGNNYHGMIKGAASGVTYEATTGPAGGPALKFNGGYAEVWRAYDLTLKNAAAGEIMATIKNDMLQTDTTQGGPWRFGTDANGGLYVSNGTLYEGFASTARKSGAVVDDTTIWNRYNVWSAPSDFSAQINGVARITTGTNTVAWHATPLIGSNGATNFIGHFGCVVMYSRKLTAAERTDLDAWLQANPSGGAPNSALPPPDPQQSAAQYINMNVGISQTPDPDGVQYVNMNVGVKITTDPDGVQYVNLNVIDPPDTMFISDGKKWYGVVLDYQLDQGLANAKQDAELYAGALVTAQGMPSGGVAGQILKKVSDKNYDAKWANETGGGAGGLPPAGAVGQILMKDSTLDGDATWHDAPKELPAKGADGLVLLTDAASAPTGLKWGAVPGGSRDRISVCPSAWTSIDEFNDDTIGSNWARVDSAGASRCTWTEGGDTLSAYNSGGDASGELHALMMPISLAGGDMAVGDAFVTCITIAGHVQTSANHIGGILLSTTSTYGSGTQISAMSWTNASMAQMNHNPYKFTNFNTATSSPTSILTVHQRMFIRLVMTAANTWRHDISVDGVSWLPGTATTQTMVPAYVGLLDSSWGNTAKHVLAYEFFRRMNGVS